MKKTDERIIKKQTITEDVMEMPTINEDKWEVLEELSGKPCDGNHGNKYTHNLEGRPCPGPTPGPKPGPCPPPKPPIPPKPEPQPKDVKFGNGLQVIGNVVSVKSHKDNGNYMAVTPEGVSILPLIKQMEKISDCLRKIEYRLVDIEDDINRLKSSTRPESITNVLVGSSKSFIVNEETGDIEIKTTNGVKTTADGSIAINSGDTLKIDAEGAIQVDYDNETIGLIGEGEDKKLSTIYDVWESDNTDNE